MNYQANKAKSRTKNTLPTLTDQSAAKETDRNIIVKKFMATGQAPVGNQGFYADMTHLPTDLQGFIRRARSIPNLRGKLPGPLRELSINQLLNLTPEQLREKLTPPAPPPAKKEGET